MQDDLHADASPPPSGGLIQLRARAPALDAWLGPVWAALCGVLASNGFRWEQSGPLKLLVLFLLVDAGWGTIWAALASTDWALPLDAWRTWETNTRTARLPYTLPGSIGDRISRWMGKLFAWWGSVFWPACGPAVQAVLVSLPMTALLGALLGPELLLLSVAVIAVMQLAVIWERGHPTVPPLWDGLVAVAFPWLAGHVVFSEITLTSMAFGFGLALTWGTAWNARSTAARIVLVSSQALAAGGLVVLRHPLAAGFLLLMLVPQMALLPWIGSDSPEGRHLPVRRFVRYTRPWLMVTMVVSALVL